MYLHIKYTQRHNNIAGNQSCVLIVMNGNDDHRHVLQSAKGENSYSHEAAS